MKTIGKCTHGFDSATRCTQCETIIAELLEAIQQRSIITAIQHFGKAGEKDRLMKARKAAARICGRAL